MCDYLSKVLFQDEQANKLRLNTRKGDRQVLALDTEDAAQFLATSAETIGELLGFVAMAEGTGEIEFDRQTIHRAVWCMTELQKMHRTLEDVKGRIESMKAAQGQQAA